MEYILPLNAPWFWFALAVLFIVIESFTFALTTVWFAIGALIMVFVSFSPLPFVAQVLIFLAVSSVLLVLTRPIALKKLKLRRQKTNVDRFIGMHGVVTQKITVFEKGQVKADGTFWTAKTDDETPLDVGNECTIMSIQGVTAIVAPKK